MLIRSDNLNFRNQGVRSNNWIFYWHYRTVLSFIPYQIASVIKLMSYQKILVQPAKSNKSKCKSCHKTIDAGALRVLVVDDREFKAYIRRHGGAQNIQCEGLSRGYFQTENGSISVQKYFVHLNCYKPIHPHSFDQSEFRIAGFKEVHKQTFKDWLEEKKSDKERKPQGQSLEKKEKAISLRLKKVNEKGQSKSRSRDKTKK